MEYEKARVNVVVFEENDVITTSDGCGQTQFDADKCDGVTQAVTKPF